MKDLDNVLNYELLKKGDSHLSELKALFELPEIQNWISISLNFFDYVVETENAYLIKIMIDSILVGAVQLEIIDDIVYLAILVTPKFQRQGIAKNAINHIINNCNCKKYVAEIEDNNIKSIKLFEALGFSVEGKEDNIITYVTEI